MPAPAQLAEPLYFGGCEGSSVGRLSIFLNPYADLLDWTGPSVTLEANKRGEPVIPNVPAVRVVRSVPGPLPPFTMSVPAMSQKTPPAESPVAADAAAPVADDRRKRNIPVAVDRRRQNAAEKRRTSERRRLIDPTTCERDYNDDETSFMKAMDRYKRENRRPFPTWSEVLEVLRLARLPQGRPARRPAGHQARRRRPKG